MQTLRWTLGPEVDSSNLLFRALALAGFKAAKDWRYPPEPAPFTVTFTDGRSEVVAEFEASEGVVVSGSADVIDRLRAEYERLGDSPP